MSNQEVAEMAREPRAQMSKVPEEEWILEAAEEVVRHGVRMMQAQRIDTEVDKDRVPKAQFKEIDAEAHPGPNARKTSLQRSWLPKNAVNRTPKLQSGATVTTRGGCSLIAEEALNQKGEAAPEALLAAKAAPAQAARLGNGGAARRTADMQGVREACADGRGVEEAERRGVPRHPLRRMVADAAGQKAGDVGSKGPRAFGATMR